MLEFAVLIRFTIFGLSERRVMLTEKTRHSGIFASHSWVSPPRGFARQVSIRLCSVQPLCALCLRGGFLSNNEPRRHRAHRGCTEKSVMPSSCEASQRHKDTKVNFTCLRV